VNTNLYTVNFRLLVFAASIAFLPVHLLAQNGNQAYPFLEQGISARSVALGSEVLAINDGDIQLARLNPSLIQSEMNDALSLSYVNFFSGANFGLAQYARDMGKTGTYLISLQYLNYGQFDYADQTGTRSGTFSASDFALSMGWGRSLSDKLRLGANAKLIYSHYETYQSFGIAVDVAASYQTDSHWMVSLVASHIGTQLKTYTGQANPLPFDLRLAFAKRLEHVPFQLSIVLDHLEKWNLAFDDPANPAGGFDPLTGDPIPLKGLSKITDEIMRHFIVGGEFYLGKNLVLRGGYNYRKRKELSINQRVGMVGFSWGFGIRIKQFQINFARNSYHLAGSPNFFSISSSLDQFK
jgi:hypothetical protein